MAGSCIAEGDASGKADVNLTGTPFEIRPGTMFYQVGYMPGGSVTYGSMGGAGEPYRWR
jgi:hypothetical protein